MLERKPQTELKLARVASRSGSTEACQRPDTCSEDIIWQLEVGTIEYIESFAR